MIRDRLVVGIRDNALSERLQLDAELTLEKAKKSIRQCEAVHEQQNILSGSEVPKLDELRSNGRQNDCRRNSQQSKCNASAGKSGKRPARCTRCGNEQHPRDKGPAKDATCHNWQKKGHYSAQCFAKNVSALTRNDEDDANLDTAFLDAATSPSAETTWLVDIKENT